MDLKASEEELEHVVWKENAECLVFKDAKEIKVQLCWAFTLKRQFRFKISNHKYEITGRGGIPGEPGREGPKGQRGVVIEIGEMIAKEKGDKGDVGYPGLYNLFIFNRWFLNHDRCQIQY